MRSGIEKYKISFTGLPAVISFVIKSPFVKNICLHMIALFKNSDNTIILKLLKKDSKLYK